MMLSSGLIRCGMPPHRIAAAIAEFDVIGVSSIFTTQTTMVLDLIRLVKEVDPTKLVIAGGVNARNLRKRFFDAGADLLVLSEAETIIIDVAEAVRGRKALTDVPGIAFRDETGREVVKLHCGPVTMDLDQLPFPAWDLLPLEKVPGICHVRTEASSPRAADRLLRRCRPRAAVRSSASTVTSRRKPRSMSPVRSAPTGTKSIDRVLAELQTLKDLGAHYIYFEDDSLFAKKKRAYTLFKHVAEMGLDLSDVNGINIVHLQKNYGGRLDVDSEFLEVIAQAGFHMLHLPFETGQSVGS